MSDLPGRPQDYTLVVVDVQPSYKDNITFDLYEFIEFLDLDWMSILYLFNGPELGMENQESIQEWLTEHADYEDDDENEDEDDEDEDEDYYDSPFVGQNFDWYEKGYAFFRSFMDEGVGDDDIVAIGKYMLKHGMNDVRDFRDEDWEKLDVDETAQELAEGGDTMYIPDVSDRLLGIPHPLLVGGGRDECLREVQLLLEILDIPYTTFSPFVY